MAPRAKRPSEKKRSKRAAKPRTAPKTGDPESERYVRDLLARGEAVKPSRRGKLRPGATHVIEKVSRDGSAEVKRVRFKLV